MSTAWDDGSTPPKLSIGPVGIALALIRAVPLVFVLLTGLLLTLLLLPIERLLAGDTRPITPAITRIVCVLSLALIGLRLRTRGTRMKGAGAVVANHSSWLDILVLNAPKRIYFVSKDEVAGWPGIGWLARATGTVFIKRDRKEAARQIETFRHRLALGHRLLFFPEGTSTDGRRVLSFKTTLFAAFFHNDLRDVMRIQPVSVVYRAPKGRDDRFYGWWGDMDLGPHLLTVLAARPQGSVELVYHTPVNVADFTDRKSLAAHLEAAVRGPILTALVE